MSFNNHTHSTEEDNNSICQVDLSIIIVNYNVKHYLYGCLNSILHSSFGNIESSTGRKFSFEVIVVDNASHDNSVQMLHEHFPWVKVIASNVNLGFSKANNLALKTATGEYLMLLNPDTLIEPQTIEKAIMELMWNKDTCDQHVTTTLQGQQTDDNMSTRALARAEVSAHESHCKRSNGDVSAGSTPIHEQPYGALTGRMIDPSGRFLKESKRGFPSPQASFYKLSGLTKLFPKHPNIAAYYRGDIDEHQAADIDIVCGAFMLMTRRAYELVGGLDESFFMYGEDIDYSWRIRQKGLRIKYAPSVRLLHYKGESSQQNSHSYIYNFYNAMVIFARKYFNKRRQRSLRVLMTVAIWAKASLDGAKRLGKRLLLPASDALLTYLSFVGVKELWARHIVPAAEYYPTSYTTLVLPIYTMLMVALAWIEGAYDKPHRPWRSIKGFASATVVLLLFYSLLDESQRYSRAILLIGATIATLLTAGLRLLIENRTNGKAKVLIVGSEQAITKTKQLLSQLDMRTASVTAFNIDQPVAATTDHEENGTAIPAKKQQAIIDSIVSEIKSSKSNQIIYCLPSVSIDVMISCLELTCNLKIVNRQVHEETGVIVGSHYTCSTDDLFRNINPQAIDNATNSRLKRTVDIIASSLILLLSPLLIIMPWIKGKRLLFNGSAKVLASKATMVGYSSDQSTLPQLKPALFPISQSSSAELNYTLSKNYAQHYTTFTDIKTIIRSIFTTTANKV